MNTGIYCIEHKESGKKYVGSASSFLGRFCGHRNLLSRGTHHSPHLQHAWNKYGEDAFEFKKLLVCSKENLLMYEQLCIDGYKACDQAFGYNVEPTASSSLGRRDSAETRAKKSAAIKGRAKTTDHRAALSAAKTGFRHSAASRAKMSLSQRNRGATSAETRAKLSASLKGKGFGERRHDGRPKIDHAEAREIRYLCLAGYTNKEVAGLYGLSHASVSNIMTGKCWAVAARKEK